MTSLVKRDTKKVLELVCIVLFHGVRKITCDCVGFLHSLNSHGFSLRAIIPFLASLIILDRAPNPLSPVNLIARASTQYMRLEVLAIIKNMQ